MKGLGVWGKDSGIPFNQGPVPSWLLRPDLATTYALEHFPGAYRDQQFEEDAEDRVLEYSRFANKVNGAGKVTMYRAFDVPLGSVDLFRLGKSWSARLEGAFCYGGGKGKGWGAKGECRAVVEGVLAAGDVDWSYSFESFLMYGPNQYEVAPRSHAPILVTAVFPLRSGRKASAQDRQAIDPPILGSAGEALEEWREPLKGGDSFNADDFDWAVETEAPPETEAQRHANVYRELVRGAVLRIGSKAFLIFADQGIVKYATLVGTKGRKYYKIQPLTFDPFEVEVLEVQRTSPEILGTRIAKGRIA